MVDVWRKIKFLNVIRKQKYEQFLCLKFWKDIGDCGNKPKTMFVINNDVIKKHVERKVPKYE